MTPLGNGIMHIVSIRIYTVKAFFLRDEVTFPLRLLNYDAESCCKNYAIVCWHLACQG